MSVVLQPLTSLSVEKIALKGLRRGIEKGLDSVNEAIQRAIGQTVKARASYYAEGTLLIALCKKTMPDRELPAEALLARLHPQKLPVTQRL